MKSKLFSLLSFKVSLKAMGSNILTMLSGFPLWLMAGFLMKKGFLVLSGIFWFGLLIWYLFFFGWISNKAWRWN